VTSLEQLSLAEFSGEERRPKAMKRAIKCCRYIFGIEGQI
jgi:hypothetical protein